MSSKEFMYELKSWIISYDKEFGCWPENEYEGISVYNFIANKLGLPEYSYQYWDEEKKEFRNKVC